MGNEDPTLEAAEDAAVEALVEEAPGRILLTLYQHIDTVWLWRRSEGHQVVLSTWRSALDRLADHPDITYVITASEHLRVPAEHDPGMLAEICEYVRQGRIQIVGGWVTEADCHVPSGEALIRLELHGQADFNDILGVTANIAMNADAFGHDPGVIQVFKDSGKKAYLYLRPSDPHESDLPRVFWWQDSFGRRILAARLTEGYNAGPNTITPRILTCRADMKARNLPVTLALAGLGNHGGELGLNLLNKIKDLQLEHPIDYSTIDDYLNRITLPGLPTINGDRLKHHARGSYSANQRMKRQLRQTEQLLLTAEKLLAMLAQSDLPQAKAIVQRHSAQLVEAWRTDYLPALFHDLAAGTAIRAGHEEAMDNLGAARSVARRAIDAAVQQITWNIRTPGDADVTPVTVFNLNGHRARIPTEVTLESHTFKGNPRLVDSECRPIACQRVVSDSVTEARPRFGFIADVPAFGYATYWLSQTTETPEPAAEATDTMIRTDLLELRIDPETGQIASLTDRRTGTPGPQLDLVVLQDEGDTWSHRVSEYTQVLGRFSGAKVRLIENGPVRAVIASHSQFGDSRLVQEFIVYHDSPKVEIRSRLLYSGRRQVLKMDFAHRLQGASVKVEGSYGFNTDRDAGEQPMQKWLSVSGATSDGTPASFAVITDSLFAYDVPDGHVRLTVLRSPVHAHHDPEVLDPDKAEYYDYMDQGEHLLRTQLLLGPEAAEVAKVSEASALFNQPAVNLVLTLRPTATLKQTNSFAEVLGGQAQIAACLRSKAADGWTIRVFNPAPRGVTATVRFGSRQISVFLGASTFKTLIVPDQPGAIRVVRILE